MGCVTIGLWTSVQTERWRHNLIKYHALEMNIGSNTRNHLKFTKLNFPRTPHAMAEDSAAKGIIMPRSAARPVLYSGWGRRLAVNILGKLPEDQRHKLFRILDALWATQTLAKLVKRSHSVNWSIESLHGNISRIRKHGSLKIGQYQMGKWKVKKIKVKIERKKLTNLYKEKQDLQCIKMSPTPIVLN